MKKFIIAFLLFLLLPISPFSQSLNQNVEEIVSEVNVDSLVSYVRILSGEDSVVVNGEKVRIKTRWHADPDKELAANYIYKKLSDYGLDVEYDNFQIDGINVIAKQIGTSYPDKYFIICAHFDSVADYCADDNASGTAAVIEAARLLSQESPQYTIIYALWDKEEIGLYGSSDFANFADAKNYDIQGVLNLDMIGFDNDNDGVLEIHTRDTDGIDQFVEKILGVNVVYDIGLTPATKNPGTLASDHAPFIRKGYPSVLFIEELYGGDFNKWYHTDDDRLDKFNLDYYHKVSKYAIASIADFTLPKDVTSIEEDELASDFHLENNFPNPFNPTTIISFSVPTPSYVKLTVHNVLGEIISTLVSEELSPGQYSRQFSAIDLPSGTYFYTLSTENFIESKKMLVVK